MMVERHKSVNLSYPMKLFVHSPSSAIVRQKSAARRQRIFFTIL